MRRREFISLIGCAMTWPLPALAQRPERIRRIGVLLPATSSDPEYQTWFGAFLQGLQQSGWAIGQNVRIEARWATTNDAEIRRHAAELVALQPDVILAHGISTVAPLRQATKTVPIVFVIVSEPVAAGFVESLARPNGNATGFTTEEYRVAGKRLELIKQIAPTVTRVAALIDASNSVSTGEFGVIQAMAPSLGVEVSPINMNEGAQIERGVTAFAKPPHSGLIVTPNGLAQRYRDLIIKLAAQNRLPTIYFQRGFVVAGGLVSYGTDFTDEYRRAAGYVDRILRGERPADLPVQAPVKYELVINRKTAKALDLTVPSSVLATADEVIE
jgi:ABC-type uncharacterized transport system substrate-binding protein